MSDELSDPNETPRTLQLVSSSSLSLAHSEPGVPQQNHAYPNPHHTYVSGVTTNAHLPRDLRLSSDSSRSVSSAGQQSIMSTSTSPGASTFLRTAATLEGLSRQLGDLKDEEGEGEVVCCCGSTGASGSGNLCGMWKEREKMEDKLKLSGGECGHIFGTERWLMGEIGDALLQRYEALERQHQREIEKCERQVSLRFFLDWMSQTSGKLGQESYSEDGNQKSTG